MKRALYAVIVAMLVASMPISALAGTVSGRLMAFDTVKKKVIVQTDDGKKTAIRYKKPRDIKALKSGQMVEITTGGSGNSEYVKAVKVVEISEGERISKEFREQNPAPVKKRH